MRTFFHQGMAGQLPSNAFRLTTAEITYRRPDFPDLLQEFIWQDLDIAPGFPKLTKFLEFWAHHLDGPLHLIRVCHADLTKPAEFRWAERVLRLH